MQIESTITMPKLDVSLPKWVFLQLLESCNLRCRMCYEWGEKGPYREYKVLNQLSIDVIRDIIATCKPAQPYYELYGGEPLLHPQIGEILQAIHEAGSKVHFPTNGTLLEKHAEMLIQYPPERIWISLDGPEEINDAQRGKGVFKKAIRGINKLLSLREQAGSAYPQIGISTVVTPANHRHLERFFFESIDISKLDCISIELQAYITEENHQQYSGILRKEFGVQEAPLSKGFICDPAIFSDMDAGLIEKQVQRLAEFCEKNNKYMNTYPQQMSEDNIRKYFTANWHSMTHIKKRCPFPWISTEINARGDVTSCHAYYDLTLGNVNDESIATIWRGEKYKQYRRYLRKHLLPICQGCCLFYNEKP